MNRLFYVGFLTCLLSTGLLRAQSFTEISGTGLDAVRNADLQWADLDRDGLPDLVLTGNDKVGNIYTRFYINNGDSTFSSTGSPTDVYDADIAITDFDHDGDLDIVIAGNTAASGSSPSMRLYVNNGAVSPTFASLTAGFTQLSDASLVWADFDNDGFADLFSTGLDASGTEQAFIYRNNAGASTTQLSPGITALSDGDAVAFDYDLDGRSDLLLCGVDGTGTFRTLLYRNTGDFTFEEQSTSLPAIAFGALAVADYNEDGWPDLFLTGLDASANRLSALFDNTTGTFVQSSQSFEGLSDADVLFADLNNNGRYDLALAGSAADGDTVLLYSSNASYQYSAVDAGQPSVLFPALATADYNQDGAIDLLITGFDVTADADNITLLSNGAGSSNAAPSSPSGLSASSSEDSVTLFWSAPGDDLTASNALSYQLYMSVNSGDDDILAANGDPGSGTRFLYEHGRQGQNTSTTLYSLDEGVYYWSVQAIDASFVASPFATEESFTICYSPDLGADTALCVGDTLSLSAGSGGDVVNWYASSLGGLAASASMSFDLPVTVNDTVVVEITKIYGCTVYDTLLVEALALPSFTLGSDTAVCFGESLPLSVSTSFDSVNWYSAQLGSILSDAFAYDHPVTESDTVWAEVYSTDGCVNYDTIRVQSTALPTPGLGADTSLCYGSSVLLDPGAGIDSVNWYTLAGDTLLLNSLTLDYEVLTEQTVIAETYNSSGCLAYDSILIGVYALPAPDLGEDLIFCIGESTLLDPGSGFDSANWYTIAGATLELNTLTHSYTVGSTDTVVVEVFNTNGCVNYDTIIIEATAVPSPDLGSDTALCVGNSLQLAPNTTYDSANWYSLSTGLLAADTDTLLYAVLSTDTLVVETFVSATCFAYDTLIVEALALPSPDLGADTALCFGSSLLLSATGYDSVNWYDYTGNALLSNSDSIESLLVATDTFIIEVYDASGCSSRDTLVAEVLALPAPDLGSDTSACLGEALSLSPGSGYDSVAWQTLSGDLLAADSDTLSYTVATTDTLVATVWLSTGCSNSDTIIVTAYSLPAPDLGSDQSLCPDTEITLSPGSFSTTHWFTIAGDTLALNSDSLAYTLSSTDTIISLVTDGNGCSNSDSLVLTAYPLPSPALGADISACFGESLTLSPGTGFAQVNWYSSSADTLAMDSDSLSLSLLSDSSIIAEVYSTAGCVNYDTIALNLYPQPLADFGADTLICIGDTLRLSAEAGLARADWYTLAGDTLTANSTTLDWTITASDTLVLAVYSTEGCQASDTLVVTIAPLPDFSIGADTTVCSGTELLFNLGTGYAEVNWYGVDQGLLAANSFFLSYTTSQSDLLLAEVTDNNGCTNTDTASVAIFAAESFALPADTALCAGEVLPLDAGSAWVSVRWRGIAQGFLSNSNAFEYTVTESDVLIASVISANGCGYEDSIAITAYTLPALDLGADSTLCEGSPITLDAGSGWAATHWLSSDSALVSTAQSINYTVSSDSSFLLQVSDANGCTAWDAITISGVARPAPDLGPDQELCAGSTLSLSLSSTFGQVDWYRADTLLLADSFTLDLQPDADQQIVAIASAALGCTGSDTLTITVNTAPTADAGADSLLCTGASMALGGSPSALPSGESFTYQWSPAAFLDNAQAANPVVSPEANTTYVLLITDSKGCTASDMVQVNVNPAANTDAGPDRSLCLGTSTVLGGSPTVTPGTFAYRYRWFPSAGLDNIAIPNPTAQPDSSTTYRLIVDDGYCPADTAFVRVEVNLPPVLSISADTTVGIGVEVPLQASGALSYTWSPDLGLSNATVAAPFATPQQNTTYTVTGRDANGCSSQASVTITVENTLFVPNLFSPNGDGSNDRFLIYGIGFESLELRIFDRQGELVYESSDIREITEEGWDGNKEGLALPNGNYFWQLQGTYRNGSPVSFEGKNSGIIKLLR